MIPLSAGDTPKHRTFDLDRSPVMLLDCPLPTSHIKGEVPLGACGAMEPHPPAGTLPFIGRVGEGTSTAQAQLAIMLPQGAGVEISDPRHSPFLDLSATDPKAATARLGIDCEAFEFRPRAMEPGAPLRVVTVGRMTERKGHRYTIEAVAALASRRPDLDVRLDVVGDGPLFVEMRELVARWALRTRVVLHGEMSNGALRDLHDRAHVFVLHCVTARDGDREGIPVSIMEAMAVGLPVVSTRHSKIPQLVADGISGLLVEERDIEGTAGAIERIADDPELAIRMGGEGRRIVARDYNAGRQARRLHALLTSLTNAKATS
jgi:colanic acid/amylovoran biosynthesis glycosyltransferase